MSAAIATTRFVPSPHGFPVGIGPTYEIAVTDWMKAARAMPADSINAVVTSVPYWGLRDYGVAGQVGLERSFADWLRVMVEGFREIARILHPSGTLWINCGDAYAQGGRGSVGSQGTLEGTRKNYAAGRAAMDARPGSRSVPAGFKHKDRMMMPARLAIALQEDGWYLRSELVWEKSNPMPESIKDRPTTAHEMVYLFSKERTYFYDADAVREPYHASSIARRKYTDVNTGERRSANQPQAAPVRKFRDLGTDDTYTGLNPAGRNRRDVWNQVDDLAAFEAAIAAVRTMDEPALEELAAFLLLDARGDFSTVLSVPTARFAGNHTATYPADLIEPIIKAATSARGVCPRCRAPWERIVVKGELDLEWQKSAGGDANGEYHGRSAKAEFIATTEGAVRAGGRPGGTGAQDPSALKARVLAGMRQRRTVGWRPTCGCSPSHADCQARNSFRCVHPCMDPVCAHPHAGSTCRACKCRCFRWGDPYEPVPAVVYDPFSGMATTSLVADRLGRHSRGSELSPEYAAASLDRLQADALARTFGEIAKNGTDSEKAACAAQRRLFE